MALRVVPGQIPSAVEVDGGEDAGTIDATALLTAGLRIASRGHDVARGALRFAGEALRVVAGQSDRRPARGDWRFADLTWERNPAYRRVMQLYLAWVETLEGVVADVDVDWRSRERARFAVTMLTSAAAPTNTFLGNPAALKHALETGGGSLVSGARQFVSDVRHNRGMPSQVDLSGFRVGENLAVTAGAVVYRDDVLEVIQYAPATGEVAARPVVFVPPQINKYYFLDLAPGR